MCLWEGKQIEYNCKWRKWSERIFFLHCAMILPYVASSNLKQKTSLRPPPRISHLDANKFMQHPHQSYAHITF
jgi:hypothetical protein